MTTAEQQPPSTEEQPADTLEAEEQSQDDVRDPRSVLEDNRKKNAENASLRERIKALEAEQDAAREAAMSQQERAIEDARKQGYKEAEVEYQSMLARQRFVTRATGDFIAPDDVLLYIDLEKVDWNSDREIDEALTKLAEERPYLLTPKSRQAMEGGPGIDQGPQGATPAAGRSPSDWMRGSMRGTPRR